MLQNLTWPRVLCTRKAWWIKYLGETDQTGVCFKWRPMKYYKTILTRIIITNGKADKVQNHLSYCWMTARHNFLRQVLRRWKMCTGRERCWAMRVTKTGQTQQPFVWSNRWAADTTAAGTCLTDTGIVPRLLKNYFLSKHCVVYFWRHTALPVLLYLHSKEACRFFWMHFPVNKTNTFYSSYYSIFLMVNVFENESIPGPAIWFFSHLTGRQSWLGALLSGGCNQGLSLAIKHWWLITRG